MKLIFTVLLVGAVVAVAFGVEYHKPCGKPACKQCYVPTHKPPCTEHVTKPVTCGVPTCVKCYNPTPKPPCKKPCEIVKPDCPKGYSWNGYFCHPDCSCKHRPEPCHRCVTQKVPCKTYPEPCKRCGQKQCTCNHVHSHYF
ncbi:small proline-rich protein 2B-like [Anopheles albimanus]|uniref:small proline-rich protein 2B-like n=1 Tax=Anopheles albimanus TaxID=7167 RepID=UPI00163EF94C|nr:small proline-rich protein 2B-like [Anopheles albimanus]XP_035788297.1 small proline-rich protein 2B-like [Anopheles albimanus]XP_035789546.1 small proline-rich protein 2B-like [Anopheles albimanus]